MTILDSDIEINKIISDLFRDARNTVKADKCLLCGSTQSSFCHSHSLPQFVLSFLSINGTLLTWDSIFGKKGTFKPKGINSVWAFHNICRNCDSRYFQDYENIINLTSEPDNKMLAQIALKNELMMFYKYSIDRAIDDSSLYKKLLVEGIDLKRSQDELNIRDVLWALKRDKKILDKKLKNGYTLLFSEILNYKVPIAFQNRICIYKSIDDKTIINDVLNFKDEYYIKPLHICVFPIVEKTIIYMFHHKDDRCYIPFDKQFNNLRHDKKLEYINYLIFKCSEHCVFSPVIDKSILMNPNLKKLAQETESSTRFYTKGIDFFNFESFVRPDEIPNFLEMSI